MESSRTDETAGQRREPTCATSAPRKPSSRLTRLLGPPLAAYAVTLVFDWFVRTDARPPMLSPVEQVILFFVEALSGPTLAPCAFVVSYCIVLGLTWLATSIFGRARWGIAAMCILLLGIVAINRVKLIYTDTALSPHDLSVAWYGLKFVVYGTPGWVWPVLVLALLGLGLGLRWVRRHIRTACLPVSSRVLLASAAVLLLGGAIGLAASPLGAAAISAEQAPVTKGHERVTSGYYHYLTLNIASNITVRPPDPPDGYGQKRIASIAERFATPAPAPASPSPATTASPATAPVQPSIILWLSESFWDINSMPMVKATPDPLVNYRRLTQEGSAFHLLVPGYGGPSSATMYEVLTGMSHKFVPAGVDEYYHLIDRPFPSVAWMMRKRGYRTLAIHADWGSCYRSAEIYPRLGFEKYEDDVEFPDAPRRGLFVSDEFLTDHVIEKIESSDRPMLIFAASMQAHAPYVPDAYRHYDVEISGNMPQSTRAEFRTYAQDLREADAALARLTDHFRKSGRPVVLVFFGDHLPPFGRTFSDVGFIDLSRDTALHDRALQHTTPALVWTNTPLSLPRFATPASGPQVIMQVMETLGIEHPFYTGILDTVGRSFPGISSSVCIRPDGQLAPPDVEDPAIEEYKLICYDAVFGKRFGWSRFFPEVPPK